MKNLLIVVSLGFLLCVTLSCKKDVMDSERAVNLIYDSLKLNEEDQLEMTEFTLDSPEEAVAGFKLNGRQLSSSIKKTDEGWVLSEIQRKKDEWIPLEYFIMLKGKLIDEWGKAISDKTVTLYELIFEEGKIKTSIRVTERGTLANPSTLTDSDGRFIIIADQRFWEGSGKFTLGVSHWNGEVYLRDSKDIIISIEVDEATRKFDLGEITVKY